MSNIIEYVNRMKDVSFSKMKFNEVDSLILSQLTYLDFGIVRNYSNSVFTFSQIIDNDLIELLIQDTWNPEKNRDLLSKVADSLRFGSIKIREYTDVFSAEEQQQFSAVTFELSDSLYYIAYRGTNATIIGWKEDFNMSYQEIIPSQITATKYFKKIAYSYPGQYILGGHSKGGNLASFAATFSNSTFQNNIVAIYNHDGPGFHQSIIETENYQNIKNKIYKTIPKHSIIGVLLEETHNFNVIQSDAIGVFQHDPFTWNIENTQFIIENSLSTLSHFTQNTISTWVKTIETDTKRVCLDSVYLIASSTGAVKFNDFKNIKPETIKHITLSIKNTDKETKRKWRLVTKLLIQSSIVEGFDLIKRNI